MLPVLTFLILSICGADQEFSLHEGDQGGTQNWNGLVVLVNSNANDEPQIVFSSDQDNYKLKYCLTLEEIFEATEYDYVSTSDKFGDNKEVSNSEIDFQNDVTWTYTEGTDGASFTLSGVPTDPDQTGDHSVFDSIEFTFQVAQSPINTNDWGVEYVFKLSGYEWTDDTAVLVSVFEFKDCGSDFASADFDSEDDTTTETPTDRRRLSDDTTEEPTDATDEEHDSGSDDGVSSEDSQEVDVGIAYFLNHGEAHCLNDTAVIPTHMVYGKVLSSDEMHVVFEHFDCNDIVQDPWAGFDNAEYTEGTKDDVNGYRMFCALLVGLLMAMFN